MDHTHWGPTPRSPSLVSWGGHPRRHWRSLRTTPRRSLCLGKRSFTLRQRLCIAGVLGSQGVCHACLLQRRRRRGAAPLRDLPSCGQQHLLLDCVDTKRQLVVGLRLVWGWWLGSRLAIPMNDLRPNQDSVSSASIRCRVHGLLPPKGGHVRATGPTTKENMCDCHQRKSGL